MGMLYRLAALFLGRINKLGKALAAGAVVVLLLLGASGVQAAEVEKDGDTATAIRDLLIGSALYDVEFLSKSPASIYGDPPDFDFNSFSDAVVASVAVARALSDESEIVKAGENSDLGVGAFKVGYSISGDGQSRLVSVVESGYRVIDATWETLPVPDDSPFLEYDGTFAKFTLSSTEPPSLYFAQFADGDGLFSQITLFSLSDTDASATINLKDDNGDPLTVDLNGNEVMGELEVDIPARGLRRFQTDGMGDTVVGSVTVESDQALSGVVVFGGTIGLAGVGASPPMGGFAAPMEVHTANGINTGLALVNLAANEATVTLKLTDDDNNLLATGALDLAGMGHRALFVTEVDWDNEVDFSAFSGVLTAKTTGTITATVIQTRPDQFATMPVAQN